MMDDERFSFFYYLFYQLLLSKQAGSFECSLHGESGDCVLVLIEIRELSSDSTCSFCLDLREIRSESLC